MEEKQADKEARVRLGKDPNCLKDYHLVPTHDRSKIKDMIKLWNRLHAAYNLSAEEFLPACGISKESVEVILRSKSGLKGQAFEDRLKVVLEGTTEPIHVCPSLRRKE